MSDVTIHFHWLDYTIFFAFLIVSTLIGLFFGWQGRKSTSTKNFLTGGGEIHWVLISFSMQATFFSAIFILSAPGEIYAYGTCYSYLGLSYFIGKPLAAHFFIPIFYKMNILSAYEYLEKRFNKFIKICGSSIFMIQTLLYLPLVLYSPALALAQVTGISILWSVLFCGLVCTLYTCLGGMKATAWNDSLQMIIIFTGLITVLGLGIFKIGGFSEFFRRNIEGGRFTFNDFRIDPTLRTTFWTQIIGGILFTTLNLSSNQSLVQKFFSSKTLKDAYKSLYMSMVCCFFIMVLIATTGLLSYAFYQDCDPLTSGRVKKLDQVVPLMVMEILDGYHGLPGLFIVTAFSAALSSMSGCLNGLAAVLLTDFIEPIIKKSSRGLRDKSRVILTRILVMLSGVYTTVMAYNAHFLGESAVQLSFSITGITGAPLFAVITVGMLCPFVNITGCIIGLLAGVLFGFWVAFGALTAKISAPMLPFNHSGCTHLNATYFGSDNATLNSNTSLLPLLSTTSSLPPLVEDADVFWLYKMSYFYYGVVNYAITFIISILISLLTGGYKNVDSMLLFRCIRKEKKSEISEEMKERLNKVRLSKALIEISDMNLIERSLVVNVEKKHSEIEDGNDYNDLEVDEMLKQEHNGGSVN